MSRAHVDRKDLKGDKDLKGPPARQGRKAKLARLVLPEHQAPAACKASAAQKARPVSMDWL